MMNLKEKYLKKAIPGMKQKFGFKNDLAVPKINKVVLNVGFGKRVAGKTKNEREKVRKPILEALNLISGQKPILTKARLSIAGFKLRQGTTVGAKVTLRHQRMYDFLDRFVHIALPRSRDFRGIDFKSIDKQGNLSIGIKEHTIFPEISTEKLQEIVNFQIIIQTTAKNKEQGLELFKLLEFPLKKQHG